MTEFQPNFEENADSRHNLLWLKILLPTLLCIAAAVWLVVTFTGAEAKCDKSYKKLDGMVSKGSFSEKYAALSEINPDLSGFLTLPESDYGIPVVTPKKNDAQYYENHLFSGEKNKYGTPTTVSDISAQVVVIRGKKHSDKMMLGMISRWQDEKFAAKNKTFSFDSAGLSGSLAVFSAFNYETEPFHIKKYSDFSNTDDHKEYIAEFKKNSKLDFKLDVLPSDPILVIMAEGETKTDIIAARLLRSGETSDSLTPPSLDTAADPEPPVLNDTEDGKKEEGKPTDEKPADKKPTSEPTDEKPSEDEVKSYFEEYDPDVDKKPAFETNRIEQTGLTSQMDKTTKVEVEQVVTMVNVVGMNKEAAKSTVKNTLGLNVKIEEIESEEKRGTVIEQSISDGAEVTTDVTVVLTVSLGITTGNTIVPDLSGGAEATVSIVLDKYNLKLGKVITTESSLEKGTIMTQSVASGEEVAVNTKIDITVSDGSVDFRVVKMPDLNGKSQKNAKAALKAAGLRVGSVKTVTSSKKAGTVISQECPAGEKIEEGSTVGFSVSNGSKVNNLTVTNQSSWSVTVAGKTYGPGAIIKGDYMDIIPCIIEAEMGPSFHIEALKAQAVATYCWLINAGSKSGAAPMAPMKTASEKCKEAASAVSGQKAMYGGEVAQTYYYAINAGFSANCKDIWWEDIPYLRAVVSEGDKKASGYKTTVSYSASRMLSMISSAYGVDLSGVDKSKWFQIKYDENGAYVRSVNLGGKKTVNGSSIRESLCNYDLRSTAFKVKYNSSTDKFTFTVYGYGHGVGLSQMGANHYANQGWSYEQILTHYYPGIKLS